MSAISHHSKKHDCMKRPSLTNQPTNKQTKNPKQTNKKSSRTWNNIFVIDSHVHSIGRSQIKLFSKIKEQIDFFSPVRNMYCLGENTLEIKIKLY